MIEFYLHIKIYLNYFPGMLKYTELGKSMHFIFWVPVPKAVEVIPDTYILLLCIDSSTKPYQGLWFNQTHLPLFQNKSLKIYINFFLSSVGYNFKIDYLKYKMRHGMWVHILLNNLA